jgi:HlyD family secretion protein
MKKFIVFIVIAAIAVGGYMYFRWKKSKNPAQAEEPLSYIKVERGPIRSIVACTGRVVPNLDVEIKCKASGEVIDIPYDISDEVKKDSLLVEMDPVDEDRRVKQSGVTLSASEARLSQARMNLQVGEQNLKTQKIRVEAAFQSAQARYEDTKAKAERVKQLFEKKLASREDLDTAQTTAVQSQADLENSRAQSEDLKTQELALELKKQDISLAEAQVESDKINLELAQQRLKDTKVFAPMDGVVSGRNVQKGQIVSSGISNVGGGTALMTLSDLSRIFILAAVDESDIGKVSEDQRAIVTADAYPGRRFDGNVVRIATKGVNISNVVTFEVKIEVLGEKKNLLKSEMTANVEIVAAENEDALLVPAEAITRKKREQIAQVKKAEGGAEERVVEVGITDGVNMEVVSGLKEGEEIAYKKGQMDSRWRGSQDSHGQPGGMGQMRMVLPRPAGGRQ